MRLQVVIATARRVWLTVLRTVAFISNSLDQLSLKCANGGAVFNSFLVMSHESFMAATIEATTYTCPVCANFDTYVKADLFSDTDH